MILRWLFALLLFLTTSASMAFVYEGELYQADGSPLAEPGVLVQFKIFDESNSCLLYSTSVTLDLSASSGHFSVDLQTTSDESTPAHNLADVVSNRQQDLDCDGGGQLSLTGAYQRRNMVLVIKEVNSVDVSDITLPPQKISSNPYSQEAEVANTLREHAQGDATGAIDSLVVERIRGVNVSTSAPTNNQVLMFNGTDYVPSDISASSVDWSAVTNIPADIADGDDDTATSQLDWTAITNIPADIADGDDDTATSQLDWTAITNIPADIADGDADTVTSQLDWTAITNIPADIADGDDDTATSQLDWTAITNVPADIADGDADTVTSQLDWTAITNIPADIADGDDDTATSQLDWTAITNIPADIADGDADTVTSQLDWTAITNIPADIADGDDDTATSQLDWTAITNIPADIADGDADTVTSQLDWTAITNIPADIADGDAQVSDLSELSVSDNSISGDKIHGGTISSFQSTGITDNASSVTLTIEAGGNVGVGTSSPDSALEIEGYIQLDTVSGQPPAGDCTATTRGRAKVDPDAGAYWVCMASGWVDTSAGAGGGGSGEVTFDVNHTEPFACNVSNHGILAMTRNYTLCVCNESNWVRASDGSSACVWADVIANGVSWSDFTGVSSLQTISGINTTITIEFSVVYDIGTPTIEYRKNGGAWTAFTPGSPANLTTENGDTYEFQVSGTDGHSATIVARNVTNGNQTMDDVIATNMAAGCGGNIVGPYCWYQGGSAESCDTVCATHGGCDLVGTRDYAGSNGTNANCQRVLGFLAGLGIPTTATGTNGCVGYSSNPRRQTDPTTCASSAADTNRACACNQ